jgi:hypothetical protein
MALSEKRGNDASVGRKGFHPYGQDVVEFGRPGTMRRDSRGYSQEEAIVQRGRGTEWIDQQCSSATDGAGQSIIEWDVEDAVYRGSQRRCKMLLGKMLLVKDTAQVLSQAGCRWPAGWPANAGAGYP